MCGIVGYVGLKNASEILIEGLKRLEYRGYDSSGLCVAVDGELTVAKTPGRIVNLENEIEDNPKFAVGTIGIAHTRWATHGRPTKENAHPHTSTNGKIALVHNGIIENYVTLKKFLQGKGYEFRSETDTEVLVHLISEFYGKDGGETLEAAVQLALKEVTGTYGLLVISADEPDKIVVARRGSPLIVGVGADEYIVASDASAILEHTANVVYLNDNEMAVISRSGMRTMTTDNVPVSKEVQQIEWSLEQIAKGGYEHFMLKEIMEQPESIRNAITGRLDMREMQIVLGGLSDIAPQLARLRRMILPSCGTAWHAARGGEFLF